MRIKLINGKPLLPLEGAPALVFIHGAWHGAWCWEENFFPYFTSKGYECYAFDLPLHGEEKNIPGINKLRISDYVDRLKQVIGQINKQVILIGHSMGGYTIQNFLLENDCAGVVLITSVPGIPAWRLFRDLLKKDPLAMLKTILRFDMSQLISSTEKVQGALFSPELSKDKVEEYANKLGPESFSIMIFDFLLKTIPSRKNKEMPLLVQCAGKDELVTIEENKYTARWQKGEFQFFKNLAHDVMLEEQWQLSADGILNWLSKHFSENTKQKTTIPENQKLNEAFPDAVQDLITTLGKNSKIDANKTKILGWGNQNEIIDPQVITQYVANLQAIFQVKELEDVKPIPLADLKLRATRFSLPKRFQTFCTDAIPDRASHCYGKSFRDIWRGLHGQFDNPPDYIAYPKTEDQILALMQFAEKEKISIIPFGGGSSVSGGVEPTLSSDYQGVITVDMKHFDQILTIDRASRSAHIQGGIFGPALEAGLKPHGLTLRHYPQSFEFSTLGGWIVTRSGGHFATLYTHIDEFVQGVRMVTPKGIMESRRLPGHGAGPSEERLVTGSEGIFGIVTSAWMRLQDIPKFKLTKAVKFKSFTSAVETTRLIAQSGLNPANARLVDPMEAFSNGLGDGTATMVIIGFESHHHPVDHMMEVALEICRSQGGTYESKPAKTGRSAKADAWKNSFLKAPYMRDELMKKGFILETFETAVTWDQFPTFHKNVKAATQAAINEHCGAGTVTCRFTHLYPDGPAPYYTIIAKGKKGQQMAQWDAVKVAASNAIIANGGTITHHHAVGKDHQPYYAQQQSNIFGAALAAVKDKLDPEWILNPDVLITKV